ncbi:MAG TPA: LysM domain-containing protein [Thermoanaerobaculia bacterium]
MFDSTSRYFGLEIKTLVVPDKDDGTREIRFVSRRIIPPVGSSSTLVEHTVAQGERLDRITARYTGDPTQYWRLCDANNVLTPEELEETGRAIAIAVAGM